MKPVSWNMKKSIKKAQATVELGVFSAILFMVLGFLFQQLYTIDQQQRLQMYAQRQALKLAKEHHRRINLTVTRFINNPNFLSRIDRYMPLRFRLGQIYSDGDDILWLLPSEVAFQIAFIVVNEFYRRMGYLKRMSVALVSFHPKFPLPVAIKIADNLLSLTKSKTRKYEILTNDSDNICGWIDFEIIEGGGFTPESLKNIRENIGLLTRRPYPVKLKRSLLDLDDFANLFNYVTGINVDFCGRLSKDMREYMKSNVRVFRRVLEYLSLEMPYDDARRIAIAYCIRQIGRFKDNLERRKNYEIALTLLEPEKLGKDIPIKLLDGYVLLKILLGG